MQTNLILEDLMAMAVYNWVLSAFFESEGITEESPLLVDIQTLSLTSCTQMWFLFECKLFPKQFYKTTSVMGKISTLNVEDRLA